MIVAVVAVRVMQMAVDEVIDMVAMRHRLMPATGAMNVIAGMGPAGVRRGTAARIRRRHIERVFFDLSAGRMM